MRLLDLFCGAIDAQYNMCNNIVCPKSPVFTATKKLELNGQAARNTAASDAEVATGLGLITKGPVAYAEKLFQSIEEIKTGDIALKSVQRRLTRNKLCDGTNYIQGLIKNTIRLALSRILASGETNTATKDLKLFDYLAGGALYAK